MKRLVIAGLVLASAAVAYAAVGNRFGSGGLLSWFEPSQRLPALRSKEMPFRYPARLWRDGVEGEVLLRIHIDEAGVVDSVELERSSGHDELDAIALRGSEELLFHPALEGDEAVSLWALLPVRFEGRRVTAAPEE